jgi:hypothetical protein
MEQISSAVVPVTTTAERARRGRRRGVLAILLGLTVVSLGAGLFSLAVFTDSDTSTGSFATGTLDIASTPSTSFTVTGMVPGDTATQALTIANNGTVALRYAFTSVASNLLGDTLTLTIKTIGTNCATFDGTTVLATTALDGAAFGSPTQGAQTGDRTLAASANEVLCFRVNLPLASDNTVQTATSAVTFTFAAEQTANNP